MAVALLVPQGAAAHAVLESTSPARGAQLDKGPARVVFRFDESVEVAFGAMRVYDGSGERVDRGVAMHPGGRGDEVAVALRHRLGDGTYTATYRVISADSHPVSGGYAFTVGRGGAPAQSLDELLDRGGGGTVTEIGFGIVRGLSYLALAFAVGGVAFVAAVWWPALRAVAGAGDEWRRASEAFAARVRALVLGSALLGTVMSALGIAFQGAVAGRTSLWQALDPTVIGDVLDTRFGTIWGLRLLAWIAVGGLVALPAARLHAPVLRPASLGATGLAPGRPAAPAGIAALALLLGFLCSTPALAGHSWTLDPRWLLVPANFLHVACMCVWVGGVGVLLLALPAATRGLEGVERTWLLAVTVSRFSAVALFAVAGLIAGGVVQAIVELDALSDLLDTAFGRAILIKVGLLVALVGLGVWNRRRAGPRLESLAQAGETPGATGLALRRSLRAEIALMATVLAVTAALVSYAPPSGAAGPFSASKSLGPAHMELTVDPARAGANEIHVYLFDRRTGGRYARVKEMKVTARLPNRGIGPLPLRVRKTGPGHYAIRRADFAPAGDWRLEVAARVSAFDLYTSHVEVPIK